MNQVYDGDSKMPTEEILKKFNISIEELLEILEEHTARVESSP